MSYVLKFCIFLWVETQKPSEKKRGYLNRTGSSCILNIETSTEKLHDLNHKITRFLHDVLITNLNNFSSSFVLGNNKKNQV